MYIDPVQVMLELSIVWYRVLVASGVLAAITTLMMKDYNGIEARTTS